MQRRNSFTAKRNYSTVRRGANQRSADQHPLYGPGMWEDSTEHTSAEHASSEVTRSQGTVAATLARHVLRRCQFAGYN